MEDLDPLAHCRHEAAEVYAHAPAEFELKTCKLSWDSPCWLDADILLKPRSEAARQDFLFPLTMSHKVDAFARLSWEDQLWKTFSQRLAQITGPHANAWLAELYPFYGKLKEQLRQTESLFQPPFRFIERREFMATDLPDILKESPENFSIYLAVEKGSYRDYTHMRIHSRLPRLGESSKCSWFEKRLPDDLHTEDVVPWFVATLRRLPKKHQPVSVEPWKKRLLNFEPQLELPKGGMEKAWLEKSKVTFVLGPTCKVGYRSLTHFERRDIRHVIRQNEMLAIEGSERYGSPDKEFEITRTFYLFAFDNASAERLERQLLTGEKVHFGLDANIHGIVCRSGHIVNSVNVDFETVRKLCVEPGLELRLISNPRSKVKTYELCTPGTPNLADFV